MKTAPEHKARTFPRSQVCPSRGRMRVCSSKLSKQVMPGRARLSDSITMVQLQLCLDLPTGR